MLNTAIDPTLDHQQAAELIVTWVFIEKLIKVIKTNETNQSKLVKNLDQ